MTISELISELTKMEALYGGQTEVVTGSDSGGYVHTMQANTIGSVGPNVVQDWPDAGWSGRKVMPTVTTEDDGAIIVGYTGSEKEVILLT